MFLRLAILTALRIAIAAADEIHLVNCQFTAPDQAPDTYSVMAVSSTTPWKLTTRIL